MSIEGPFTRKLEFPPEYYERESSEKERPPAERAAAETDPAREESRVSWLSTLRNMAKTNYLIVGVASLAWLEMDSMGRKFAETEGGPWPTPRAAIEVAREGAPNAFTMLLGEEKVPVDVFAPANFDPKGGDKRLSAEGEGLLALLKTRSHARFLSEGTEADAWALDAFYEKELRRLEILAEAGLTTESDLDEITPRQCALLARAIITSNLSYDPAVAEALEILSAGEPAENLEALGKNPADQKTPAEIYYENLNIVCRHAVELFTKNVSWLKEHHGKNLQNLYASSEIGRLLLFDENGAFHAWNRLVHLEDVDHDGVADKAAITYLETTPLLSQRGSEQYNEAALTSETFEMFEGLAKLRANGVLDAESYLELYETIRANAIQLGHEKGAELTLEEAFDMRKNLMDAFERGVITLNELSYLVAENTALVSSILDISDDEFENDEMRRGASEMIASAVMGRVSSLVRKLDRANVPVEESAEMVASYVEQIESTAKSAKNKHAAERILRVLPAIAGIVQNRYKGETVAKGKNGSAEES